MAATAAHNSNDVLRLLLRVAGHLGACADGKVEVDAGLDGGKKFEIVQIQVTADQIAILKGVNLGMECRNAQMPCMIEKSSVQGKRVIGFDQEKRKDVYGDFEDFSMSGGNRLWIGDTGDAKGRFFGCYIRGGVPVFRYAFCRQVLSNFCMLKAIPLHAQGVSDAELKFCCVEQVFQLIKFILAGANDLLESAVAVGDPGDMRTYGRQIDMKLIDQRWFNSVASEKPVSHTTMYFLQAWAATCPFRFNVLLELMKHAVQNGVRAEDVHFFEHTDFDSIYGTGCSPDDYAVMFGADIDTKGKNIMGKALDRTALMVYKIGKHEDYINWFKRIFETPETNRLFVLKRD
jgi:predicted NAD-dependent protein-ADP-ribosyltransferase YbiA (DUF1768 family)